MIWVTFKVVVQAFGPVGALLCFSVVFGCVLFLLYALGPLYLLKKYTFPNKVHIIEVVKGYARDEYIAKVKLHIFSIPNPWRGFYTGNFYVVADPATSGGYNILRHPHIEIKEAVDYLDAYAQAVRWLNARGYKIA